MIRYTSSLDGITPAQLEGFFVDAGWPAWPDPDTHWRLLEGSNEIVLAIDESTGNVIGFITAISDGVLCAYIPLLEVREAWQDQGIGSELVQQMLDKLSNLYMIDLLCDEELQPFYARLGMRPATGMLIRNHHHQTGRKS